MAKKTANKNNENSTQKIKVSNSKSQVSSNIKTVNPVSSKKLNPSKGIVAITHEQIAERAKSIWMNQGCPNGQDDKNWYEAESQLKQELGIS